MTLNLNNLPQKLPDYPTSYVPSIVEIWDQIGVLVKIHNLKIVYNAKRPKGYQPNLICYYFDGTNAENIAFLQTLTRVYINRISNLAALSDIVNAQS